MESVQYLLQWPVSMWNYIMNYVISLLQLDLTADEFKGVYDIAMVLRGALEAVGVSLVTVFWALGTVRSLQQRSEIKATFVLSHLVRYTLATVLVKYSSSIFIGVWNVGIGLIQLITNSYSPTGAIIDLDALDMESVQFFSVASDNQNILLLPGELIQNLYSVIPALILFLVCAILFYVLAIYLLIICINRVLKILVTIVFAPIGMSFFGGDSTHQMGWQYVRSYAGQCLRGAVIIVIIILYSKLMETDFINGILNPYFEGALAGITMGTSYLWEFYIEAVLKALLMVGMIKGSDHFIKEQFGL